MAEALGWAREQGLSVDDDLSYVREFEHITLAKVLLARCATDGDTSSLNEVARLLERLLAAADAGGRTGNVIEILVLQALTQQGRRRHPRALAALERALTLAEPEGYVRVFVGEGSPMASLLAAVARQRAGWDSFVGSWPPVPMTVLRSPRRPPSNRPPRQGWILSSP